MTSHAEVSSGNIIAKEAGLFMGAMHKGMAAGLTMAGWEMLNGYDMGLSFMDGGLLVGSIALTHTFLEGLIFLIERFFPSSALEEFASMNVDVSGNLTSSIVYAIMSRFLGGWSPFDNGDHISSIFFNTVYAFALTSGSEFVISKTNM
jgi:hypothetical protein